MGYGSPALLLDSLDTRSSPFFFTMKLEPMKTLELIARASPTQNRTPDLPSAPVAAAGKQGTPESLVMFMDYYTSAASWDSGAIFLEVRAGQRWTRH